MTLETCVRVEHNAGAGRITSIREAGGRGGLTVGLVRLVEDVLLKVFLVLHVGVDVGVVVLKHTHTHSDEAEMTALCVAG